MKTQIVKLPISENYIKSWDYNSGIREIIQNAVDQDSEETKLNINHDEDSEVLYISNKNTKLDIQTLILGNSSKSKESGDIGQFGEGYKLAALCLLRSKMSLTIFNPLKEEIWEPLMVLDEVFGQEILAFKISKYSPKKNDTSLTFKVHNIPTEKFDKTKYRFLIDKSENQFETNYGTILEGKNVRGEIYIGGIYVVTLKDFDYGYDFLPGVLETNRDRNIIDEFSITWNSSKMWEDFSVKNPEAFKLVSNLLREDKREISQSSHSYFTTSDDFEENVVKIFKEANGKSAYPVSTDEERKDATLNNLKPVTVPANYKKLLLTKLPSMEKIKAKKDNEYTEIKKLTPLQLNKIKGAKQILSKILKINFTNIEIKWVNFYYKKDRLIKMKEKEKAIVFINKDNLKNKHNLLFELLSVFCCYESLLNPKIETLTLFKQYNIKLYKNLEGKK